MGKWFAGILSSVIIGVLIYWLTVGSNRPTPQPAPRPQPPIIVTPPAAPAPKVLRGYLAVNPGDSATSPEDLRPGTKICVMKDGASFLRSYPPLAKYPTALMSPAEIYQGFTHGICGAIFFTSREQADKRVPVNVTYLRLIPVRE